MGMCFVPGCKHYSSKHTCKFFRFPKPKSEKNKWISLIRRKDREPSQFSKVCDCHFVNREKKNLPTLFEFNKAKKFTMVSPETRKRTVKEKPSSTEPIAGTSKEPDNVSLSTEPVPGTSKEPCSDTQEVVKIKLDNNYTTTAGSIV